MYFGTAIAAIILPYKKKELFEASPIAQMKVAGIPLITVAGVIFGGFLPSCLWNGSSIRGSIQAVCLPVCMASALPTRTR